MSFKLGSKSLTNLTGVHPDLIKVVKRAIELTPVDFTVFEGLRTLARQKQLYAQKKTKTLKSRHIPESNKCKMGCAVDLVPLINGSPSWADVIVPTHYRPMGAAVKQAAKELGVVIEWGGDWGWDFPHFELDRRVYPYA